MMKLALFVYCCTFLLFILHPSTFGLPSFPDIFVLALRIISVTAGCSILIISVGFEFTM